MWSPGKLVSCGELSTHGASPCEPLPGLWLLTLLMSFTPAESAPRAAGASQCPISYLIHLHHSGLVNLPAGLWTAQLWDWGTHRCPTFPPELTVLMSPHRCPSAWHHTVPCTRWGSPHLRPTPSPALLAPRGNWCCLTLWVPPHVPSGVC